MIMLLMLITRYKLIIFVTFFRGEFEAPNVSSLLVWTINKSFGTLMKSSFKSYMGDEWGTYYEKTTNDVLTKVPIEDLFLK